MLRPRFNSKSITILLATMLSTIIVCSYALQSTRISLEIQEPLKIMKYPSELSVFPGQILDFTITVRNSAPVTYNITLNLTLNDTTYQTAYVNFSDTIYTVAPGDTDLLVSLEVSSSAPTAQLTLYANTNRGEPLPNETISTTVSPTMTLFGGGARWAAGNGTTALYVNWFDSYNAHYLSGWPNWNTTWWPKEDLEKMKKDTVSELSRRGFKVECVGDVPEDISKYNLVVFEAWWAVEPKHSQLVREYLGNGGNVVVMQGVPSFFSVYCKDWWPYRFGGTDLSSLQDWFGSSSFANTGGKASLAQDNPFGISLLSQDYFFYGESYSCYGLVPSSLSSDSHVIASWNDGIVFAFTHEYGKGRVYFQAVAE